MATYDVGERVVLSTELRDSDGELTNADVVLTVTTPSGTLSPVLSNPSTGNYSGSFVVAEPGDYRYLWTSSGAVEVVDGDQFTVVPAGSSQRIYASVEELRHHLGDATRKLLSTDELRKALAASSRAIDHHCGRRFWRDSTPTTRRYRPIEARTVSVMDIASLDDLVVSIDSSGTGAYDQALVHETDFELGPDNSDVDGFGAYSWNEIYAIGAYDFPLSVRRPTVRVTAYHGWSAIPDEVREATIIKATSLFKRGDAPFGMAGSQEFGLVRLSRFEDPDVIRLLDPFVPPLVGVI